VRFLPSPSYGTAGYPERIARRLRALNIAAWIASALGVGFAVVQFLDSAPDVWKSALSNAIFAPIFAAVPLLHRFGPTAAAAFILPVAYLYLSIGLWLSDTDTGIQFYFLASTGLTFLFFGIERKFLSALYAGLALALIIFAEILVPHDTGLVTPAVKFGTFLATVTGAVVVLMATVFFALREAAQAEQNLVHEKEQVLVQSRQLEIANKYKSHFLASASHDLRQPLHALNLFVSQLQGEADPAERSRLVGRIDASVGSMNELFEALLDMTKLEAGILRTNVTEFPIARLLERIETTFADVARKKGLNLHVVRSSAWVSSDPILLERILLNLVSNAVRYTERGGVVVGCRRRSEELRIDVCDTGAGIPEEQRQRIFGEFYQMAGTAQDRSGGLGLGLAIVDRLGRLLSHQVELDSLVGRGSRFSITVPLAAQPRMADMQAPSSVIADPARGKRVLVIDDDALVLDGMRGILQSWGCEVETAASGDAALAGLAANGGKPDLIISDSRLANGETGIEAIARLRQAAGTSIPAFVITGDTAPERLREASAGGFHLLHKPVSPMALRTTLNRLLRTPAAIHPAPAPDPAPPPP
jgi:signal transduction histidine kinase/CheY-like chemotaxis protein